VILRHPRLPVLEWTLLAVGVVFTAALVRLVDATTHYFGEDFALLLSVARDSVWKYVWMPQDVHIVPLQHVLKWLVQQAAPLNYRLALAVMVGFHAATLVYLAAIMNALGRSRANAPLVLLYAASPYLLGPLLWWSAGSMRFPYIFFAVAAVHHYLRFRQRHSRRQLAAVLLCVAFAIGFFTKGYLVPAYLLGVELALLPATPVGERRRNLALGAGLLVAVLLLYAVTTHFVPLRADFALDWDRFVRFQTLSLRLLLAPRIFFSGAEPWNAAVWGVAWISLLAYSVFRAPSSVLAWLAGAGAVVLNLVAVGASERVRGWGVVVAIEPRQYTELWFLVVIFVGLALHAPVAARWQGFRLPPWPRRLVVGVGAALAIVYAGSSYAWVHAKATGPRFEKYRHAKVWMDNFKRDIRPLLDAPPPDVNLHPRTLPVEVGGPSRVTFERFLWLLDFTPTFDPGSENRYFVGPDGRISRIQEP